MSAGDPGALLGGLSRHARDLLAEVAVRAAPGRAALVGGAVRDLLLADRRPGRPLRDLDVVLEGDAEGLARGLADAFGGELAIHGRFDTATVWTADGVRVDLAAARAERYARPGVLPEVGPATLEQDLGRRDFSIHAIALVLGADGGGPLLDPTGGRRDLEAGRLRVLHPESFRDDPTRILRATRYAARLGFTLGPATARWRAAAVSEDVAAAVSGDRLWAEWSLLATEDDPVAALRALHRDGGSRALRLPQVDREELDRDLAAVAAVAGLGGAGIEPAEGFLAAWLRGAGDDAREAALTRLGVPEARHGWFAPPAVLDDWTDPVACREGLDALPGPARAALCAAHGEPACEALRWYAEELRWVRPLLRGRDLLELGLAPGPRVSEVLRSVWHRQLRGAVRTREQALDAAREELGELDG